MSDGLDYERRRHYELEAFAHQSLFATGIRVLPGTPVKIDAVMKSPDVIESLKRYPVDETAHVVVHFPSPVAPVDRPYDFVLPVDMDEFVNDSVRAAVQVSEYFKNQCMDIDLVTATATYRLVSATEAHLVLPPP